VIPSAKVNISLLCRPFPPLFLLLLPHPNSSLPNYKQPPLKKKKLIYLQKMIKSTTNQNTDVVTTKLKEI
jgi:hypothetical protein